MNAAESKNVVPPSEGRRKLAEYVVHRMVRIRLFDYTAGVLSPRQVSSSVWCAADQGTPADFLLQTSSLFLSPPAASFHASPGRDIAPRCSRPRSTGRNRSCVHHLQSSRVAPLVRDPDGAARHPCLVQRSNRRIVSVKPFPLRAFVRPSGTTRRHPSAQPFRSDVTFSRKPVLTADPYENNQP